MTDADLLAAIRGSPTLRALADAGQDDALARQVTATLPQPAPVTVQSLLQAAPQTLSALAAAPDPLANMDVIAARVRAGDAAGVGAWADTLALLGKMPQAEHAAVQALVAAAGAGDSVTHQQVSRVLNVIRPVADGAPRAQPIAW